MLRFDHELIRGVGDFEFFERRQHKLKLCFTFLCRAAAARLKLHCTHTHILERF